MDRQNDVKKISKTVFLGVLLFIVPDIVLCMLGKHILLFGAEFVVVFLPAMVVYFSQKIPQKHKKYIWGFLFLYKFLYVVPSMRMRVLLGVSLFIVSTAYAAYYLLTTDESEQNHIVFMWAVFYAAYNPFVVMRYIQIYDSSVHLRIYIVSAVISAVLAFIMARKYREKIAKQLATFSVLLLVMTYVIGISFTSLNFALDGSEPVYLNVPVVNKYSASRHTPPSLGLGGVSGEITVYVDNEMYHENNPGYVIPAVLYDGFFGIEYVSLVIYE